MLANCLVCGSRRDRVKCRTCDNTRDADGNMGISPRAEVTVSNTCMRVNDRPFVVDYPPVDGVTLEDTANGKVVAWSNEQGVQHTPLSDVRGYWA